MLYFRLPPSAGAGRASTEQAFNTLDGPLGGFFTHDFSHGLIHIFGGDEAGAQDSVWPRQRSNSGDTFTVTLPPGLAHDLRNRRRGYA